MSHKSPAARFYSISNSVITAASRKWGNRSTCKAPLRYAVTFLRGGWDAANPSLARTERSIMGAQFALPRRYSPLGFTEHQLPSGFFW